ncbi:serine/threonine-protein kinase [Pseudomonas mangrovi]|uniref:non-specific serine/threonine protein kinase n=1 Tax=Pseudomonas mangrovi TaxID=2161748 RepID=A0A2T5PAD0_9PSED|nr:serine/threonine-protein kinase [Pseudomonas mangrovi]PTU74708.1 serine/threonine protein kinase [Pseudomonas mangrovi]
MHSEIEIPGYDIERVLGEGAMAKVYLATQRSLERKVALKVMSAALAADPTFCERFLREGKMQAKLSNPYTVGIFDIGNVGNLYYMAMEYLPNGTLKERMREGMSPEEGIGYLRQVAQALGYAHSKGLVHRDVKPANILFRADGTAVLSDFGIAKSLDDRTQFTQAGFSVGTPSYMSPEQARGQDIDGRADLYALGVVLYEILTGKLPYSGSDSLSTALAHLTEPLPELPIHQGRFQNILRGLLAKDPKDRFPTAAAFIAALDALLATAPPATNSDATVVMPVAGSAPAFEQSVPGQPAAVSVSIPPLRSEDERPTVAPTPTPTAQQQRPTPVAPPGKSRAPLLTAVAIAVALAIGGGLYFALSGPGSEPKVAQEAGDGQPAGPKASGQGADPADDGKRPLLMAGKKTLFQRVLTKPGARLLDEPGGTPRGEALPAFTVAYVYERREQAGETWLRIGVGSDGRSDGWLAAPQTSDWKQSLVLRFTERSGRAPVMFLRDATELERLLGDPQLAREALRRVETGGDHQVLAIEPTASAIPQDQFYLLPILESWESFDASGQPAQLLNIASIDPGNTPQERGGSSAAVVAPEVFRTGIVLVVDTSVSMQPYIDRVREVVREVQGQLAARGELDKVSFGLVGFRSSVAKTPGLEYVTRTLVTLDQGSDPDRFLAEASKVQATTVSSHAFNEDAFAGVMEAVDGMDWSPYAGRIVLLITDAGALRKNDPLGRTRMNEAEVREAARAKQIRIFALHLKTDPGRNNHAYAESQYRALTADANPTIGDLYVPVPGGDVARFGERVREISGTFTELVHAAAGERRMVAPSWTEAPSLAQKSAAVGYAMHMDFLGRRDSIQAPQLVTAWTSDRDLTNPALPSFQVCVLLTKLQLNDLQQSLKLIVDSARRTRSSPKDFFAEIASASAHMSRDPSALARGSNLVDSGILGEYLEGLPYRSKSLNMTQDLWLSLSVAEQQDFIDELESKIRLYETFHNDLANWVRFGDAEPGDALYRVPLSTLP